MIFKDTIKAGDKVLHRRSLRDALGRSGLFGRSLIDIFKSNMCRMPLYSDTALQPGSFPFTILATCVLFPTNSMWLRSAFNQETDFLSD